MENKLLEQLIDFVKTLSRMEEKISQIEISVNNHLKHDHKKAEIVSWIQTAVIIVLFAFLKWGR